MEGKEMEGIAREGREEGLDREYERKGWREVKRSMLSLHMHLHVSLNLSRRVCGQSASCRFWSSPD